MPLRRHHLLSVERVGTLRLDSNNGECHEGNAGNHLLGQTGKEASDTLGVLACLAHDHFIPRQKILASGAKQVRLNQTPLQLQPVDRRLIEAI